jgi:RNA polymerase sigma-70 factor (ECF subfamily)
MIRGDDAEKLLQATAQFRRVVGFKVRRSLGWWNPDWEDLTNDILALAVAKIQAGEFRGESSLGTFIYSLTRNLVADYFRDKSRVFLQALDPPSPLPGPEERTQKEEEILRLEAAVRKLKPKYREVVYHYLLKGLSREETARALGLTVAQVSDRANYALKLLRRSLGSKFFPFTGPGND